jgi:alkanesulfonate monooxygenase SsuD/methylene tetrahydromethanopterin reductase-like flavin-dependent oxidoreductase (luciferase family)
MLFPPGYLSFRSYKNLLAHKKSITGGITIEQLMGQGIVIVGSPDTVRKKILAAHREVGFANFVALLHFGTLPRDLTEGNIRRFATEVLPALRPIGDKEYKGFEIAAAAAQ